MTGKLIRILLSVTLALGVFSSAAQAAPLLQIFSPDAIYDPLTESWTATGPDFDIWIIGNVDGPGGKGPINNVVLAVSVSGPEGSGVVTLAPTTTGDAVVDGITFLDPSTPVAPVALADEAAVADYGAHLSPGITGHAEYADADAHYFMAIGDFTLTDSATADFSGGPLLGSSAGTAQINAYTVSVTGFTSVHFDAFNSISAEKHIFAPFSHDAAGFFAEPIVVVPEPSSWLLLGVGAFAMFGFGFRRRR